MSFTKNNFLFKLAKYDRLVFWCLVIIIFIRVSSTGIMGLMPQDAYYYFYSQHLALSYFDHPPAIAYMLRLFTVIFGQHVYTLKLAALVVTTATVIAFYYLGRLFLEKEKAKNPVLLMLSTFMVSILSLVSTPDVPLLLFWTLALLALHQAVFLDKKWYWLLSGFLMGLAFNSKYTAIFLPLGLVLFLVLSANHRRYLLSGWLWLSALVFLVTVSPVIIWNIQNNFASFRFQTTNRAGSVNGLHIDLTNFLGVLGHQSALLIPILFFGLIFFLSGFFRKTRWGLIKKDRSTIFLLCFFLPVFLSFISISFFYWVKLNWMMPAYITGLIWVSGYFSLKWIRYQFLFSLVIHLVLAFEIMFYPFPVKSDDTWYGWKELATKVRHMQDANPAAFVFSADDYKTSAVLNFYLGKKVYYPNVIGQRALQLDFMPDDLQALAGKNSYFLDSSPGFDDENKAGTYPPELTSYFSSVQEMDPILIWCRGKSVRKFYVYFCRNYQPAKTKRP